MPKTFALGMVLVVPDWVKAVVLEKYAYICTVTPSEMSHCDVIVMDWLAPVAPAASVKLSVAGVAEMVMTPGT